VPKTLRALGIDFFSNISGDSERKCTGCTLSERPPERTEKDIPKVVRNGEINPKKRTKSSWLLQPLRQNKRHVIGGNPVKINKINSQTANFQVGYYPILNKTTIFTDLRR